MAEVSVLVLVLFFTFAKKATKCDSSRFKRASLTLGKTQPELNSIRENVESKIIALLGHRKSSSI